MAAAGFDITMVKTERRNHARDIIHDMSPDEFKEFDIFCTVGGDGIPHEVINGFYSREDRLNLHLNIGVLPGGSGCALQFCILNENKLNFSLENAIYVLTRKRQG